MNVMRRRCTAGILSAALMLAVCGCGSKEAVKESNLKPQPSSEVVLAETEEIQTEETKSEENRTEETQTEEIPHDDSAVYDAVLEHFYMLISNPDEDYDDVEGATGVLEAAGAMGGKAASANIGYAIEDFSGDGIPELLIGAIEEGDEDYGGTQIYTAYTLVAGEPRLVFEGWCRNSYQYMGDGRFFNEGSGSAASFGFGIFKLLQDGTSLSCEDFYFTDWLDEDFTEIGIWHNTSGEWDKSASEKLDMTQEDLWKLEEEMRPKNPGSVELLPFSTLGSADETSVADEPQVCVQWAEDVELPADYDEYNISASAEPNARIVFTTDRPVEAFSILKLTLTNVSESGAMEFDASPAEPEIGGLNPERPLVIGLTFEGDLPCYGFQYNDANGECHRFALEISGKDGSILIREAGKESTGFVL